MQLRILLTHHLPLGRSATGQQIGRLADELRQRGHRVRCLVVDRGRAGADDESVRRIVCDPNSPDADLKIGLPTFEPADNGKSGDSGELGGGAEMGGVAGTVSFAALSDGELTDYRNVLRDVLDDEVAHFNPHIIHGQHIWLQGHLALEAGVPYLLSARGPELDLQASDSRYRRYAQEAAENAGRIIVPDEQVFRAVTAAFGELDHRVVLVPDDRPERIEGLYEEVLRARFGSDFRPE